MTDKATPSLRQRCDTALQSLPDAPYKTMLAVLFDDMTAEVERLAAQSAQAPAQAVQEAPAVRMLTDAEQTAIIDMHNTGRAQGDHECAEDIQHKFAEVNGLRIPADGKIGSAA